MAAHNISSSCPPTLYLSRLSSEFSSSASFLPSPHLSPPPAPSPPSPSSHPPLPGLLLTFLPICHLLLPLLTPLPSSLPFPPHPSTPRQAPPPLPRPVLLQPIEEGSQSMTGQIYNSNAAEASVQCHRPFQYKECTPEYCPCGLKLDSNPAY